MTAATRWGAVILAAGAGRRLGGVAKATLRDAGGVTFLARIAAITGDRGIAAVAVTAEPHRAETEAEAGRLGIPTALNPAPARGMASSVAIGVAEISARCPDADGLLVWPVDHARVRPATVDLVLARADATRIAIPTFAGRGGHPTLFGRATWAELAACVDAADGARSVVRADPARVIRVEVDDPGVVADVDRPADLTPPGAR